MSKNLYIAEKPSVAREFAKALNIAMKNHDGYMEGENAVVTWCVGHLVTMSYPEVYDIKYKRWKMETLPFLPEQFKYEVIKDVKKQFGIVSTLLNREDIETIYVCTDSGREGEYIYRLVDQMAHVQNKSKKRVWIDSQTEEEINRGIKEAKDLSEYDNLSESAFLRAKEDYLMGINFSRYLTLKYGSTMAEFLKEKYIVVSVGRVMTCVLGMVVKREREIRDFQKVPFFKVVASICMIGKEVQAEWKVNEKSFYFNSPRLYKDNGFQKKEDAGQLIQKLSDSEYKILNVERKNERKNPPLLYNLAELQNDCSRYFKISPDQTLTIVQELYEKKLVTYPRTDARVLSTAVSKEINKNISGLQKLSAVKGFVQEILETQSWKGIVGTRYVNDKQITDHYAIIPTGQGLGSFDSLNQTAKLVYEVIVRRFLAIFFPAAVYQKVGLTIGAQHGDELEKRSLETFITNLKVLKDEGYLKIMQYSFKRSEDTSDNDKSEEEEISDIELLSYISSLKKGCKIDIERLFIKEGETAPPKRYNSGSLILAMENAGQLIDDEELRSQIKGQGIGTSATRAEILKKLIKNRYLSLNKKTQIITPDLLGEMIYDVVNYSSVRPLLNPELTASWEKGLSYVAEGVISSEEYMKKLDDFITRRIVKTNGKENTGEMIRLFRQYENLYTRSNRTSTKQRRSGT
ncbi:MAG: DNA topoisomerase [Lachnospiraceae bacterium]